MAILAIPVGNRTINCLMAAKQTFAPGIKSARTTTGGNALCTTGFVFE